MHRRSSTPHNGARTIGWKDINVRTGCVEVATFGCKHGGNAPHREWVSVSPPASIAMGRSYRRPNADGKKRMGVDGSMPRGILRLPLALMVPIISAPTDDFNTVIETLICRFRKRSHS